MDRLVQITGARISDIARHYAAYKLAVSNDDNWGIVYYGSRVLTHLEALGISASVMDPQLRPQVELATKLQQIEVAK